MVFHRRLPREVFMWPGCGPFTSPPLTDWHSGNFGVVPVILLGLNLVAQTFPQAEWAQLLLDARMHSGLWSHLLEPVVLQSVVYISATPVLCARSSSPFCGCLLRGSYSTCRWWQFCLLVLPESKFVALCLLPTLAHVFQLQKFGHLAPQGDLPATPIPVDLCQLCFSLYG